MTQRPVPREMDERIELAWAAGFFDGEGTTTAHKGNASQRLHLMVAVKQTVSRDEAHSGLPDVLVRFAAAVGVGRIGGPYLDRPGRAGFSEARRPQYMWYAKADAAQVAVRRLWLDLGDVKRAQAEAAIALWKSSRTT